MSKRPRSSSPAADEESVPSASPVQSELVWFGDGNVIIQAENTRFKVHRGVLAKHSPVFADLFKVPQPDNEPVVDGCPIVHLPDKADDVSTVLCLLYGDNDAVGVRRFGTLSLHAVESMIRLGKKYQIGHLYEVGLRHLKKEFPTQLFLQDEARRYYERCFSNFRAAARCDHLGSVLSILKLAHECSLQSILPASYLYALRFPVVQIMRHAQAQSLSFDTIRRLVCGREILFQAWKEQVYKIDEDNIQGPECTSLSQCSAALETIRTLLSQHPPDLSEVFLPWRQFAYNWQDAGELVHEILCKACADRVGKFHDNTVRSALWRDLPSFFELPAWKELKDAEV